MLAFRVTIHGRVDQLITVTMNAILLRVVVKMSDCRLLIDYGDDEKAESGATGCRTPTK